MINLGYTHCFSLMTFELKRSQDEKIKNENISKQYCFNFWQFQSVHEKFHLRYWSYTQNATSQLFI